MASVKIKHNARDIARELDWLKTILRTRSALNAKEKVKFNDVLEIPAPILKKSKSPYAQFIKTYQLNTIERFLLILAAIPHIKPEMLDVFIQKNPTTQQLYTEFGGRISQESGGFLPTGETVMFVLAANDLARRFELLKPFEGDHFFAQEQILWLTEVKKGEPFLNGTLTLSQEILDLFTTGEVRKPNFSAEFPARLLTSPMQWKDLVLNPHTLNQIDEINTWLQHKKTLLEDWKLAKILKPGYKALFYGPPGTGKSLTATLLGQKTGLDVYRIDLSQMVSKYIGETEKNLSKVFDKAEHKDWILFFDEGDALFGKRTQTKDAHDRYANQQVSYLLQRIEEYDGLVVLASNRKNNIDEAFLRRFQTMIHFPVPGVDERFRLWKNSFSTECKLEDGLDLKALAGKYELSGGEIVNVVQYASLLSLRRESNLILLKDVMDGVRKEFRKKGRTA